MKQTNAPFAVHDCALIAAGTGFRAQNLREFSECLGAVEESSIYHHFWGRLLQPRFDEPEYLNDFASWANRALHDPVLAERLSMIDPADFGTIAALRQELMEIAESRLDEREMIPWARSDQQFHFLKAQMVIFDTNRRVAAPEGLAEVIPELTPGSVFYHFIDARRRTASKKNDFSAWLEGFGPGFEALSEAIDGIDPYFSSLMDTREKISAAVRGFLSGGRE